VPKNLRTVHKSEKEVSAGEIHKRMVKRVKKLTLQTVDDVVLDDITGNLKIEATRVSYSRTLKDLAPFVKAVGWVEGGRMENLTDENIAKFLGVLLI
jgi:DNA/RNA endonuclease YhcR with UshA esterase domain